MEESNGNVKRWHPYPTWWYGLGGASAFTVTAIGLKYLWNGVLGLHDILPWILAGAVWFSVSAYLGWLHHRGRST